LNCPTCTHPGTIYGTSSLSDRSRCENGHEWISAPEPRTCRQCGCNDFTSIKPSSTGKPRWACVGCGTPIQLGLNMGSKLTPWEAEQLHRMATGPNDGRGEAGLFRAVIDEHIASAAYAVKEPTPGITQKAKDLRRARNKAAEDSRAFLRDGRLFEWAALLGWDRSRTVLYVMRSADKLPIDTLGRLATDEPRAYAAGLVALRHGVALAAHKVTTAKASKDGAKRHKRRLVKMYDRACEALVRVAA